MAARERGGNAAEVMTDDSTDDLHNADFAKCKHGIRDDGDCGTCNANGCSGGGDCECGGRYSKRNPMPKDTLWLHDE